MTFIVLIALVIFQHLSENKATLCTIVYALSVAAWSIYLGNVTAYAMGQMVGTMILGGLYFGFLGRLDKEKWVYWTLMIGGGLLLGLSR
jgi:hypothetical protein